MTVVVHVDAPDRHRQNDRNSTGRDYTATGLARLLRICADLGIEVTTTWTHSALTSHPQLARTAHDQGHELAVSLAVDSTGHDQKTTLGPLAKISRQDTTGYMESLPGEASTFHQLERLGGTLGAAPSWLIPGAGGDTPVMVRRPEFAAPVVQLPVSPYWLDSTWLGPEHPSPPSSLLEAWSASLASVREEGALMTIVLNPHIAGRPGFSRTFVHFLDEAIASGDVWMARADHVALWWRANSESGS